LEQLIHGAIIDGTALVYENNIVLTVFYKCLAARYGTKMTIRNLDLTP
jgi:hypothetical protein